MSDYKLVIDKWDNNRSIKVLKPLLVVAASRTEFAVEKKPPLPPINPATVDAVPSVSISKPKQRAASSSCPVALVIAGPGSGRGRFCKAVAARYGFCAISMGDLVRANDVARAATVGNTGRLTDQVALALLADALDSLPPDCKGVFIEGYPRSEAQLADLLNVVHRIDAALLLDFDEITLRRRLERVLSKSEASARLEEFRLQTLPVCRYFDDEGKLLLLAVDGEPSSDGDSALLSEAAALLDPFFKQIEAPVTAGPILFIRSLASDPLATAATGARTPELPACPLVLIFGGPGSRRSELTRRLKASCDGCLRIHAAEGEGDEGELGDGAAISRLLDRSAAAATAAKAPRCILLEGLPTCEAGLQNFCARLGKPEFALLVDCHEDDMLGRLLQAGAHPEEVAQRMRYFKEETLPVVRHLDEAGRLFVVQGDQSEDVVLHELKSALEFVLYNRLSSRAEDAEWIRKQPVLLEAAERLRIARD